MGLVQLSNREASRSGKHPRMSAGNVIKMYIEADKLTMYLHNVNHPPGSEPYRSSL